MPSQSQTPESLQHPVSECMFQDSALKTEFVCVLSLSLYMCMVQASQPTSNQQDEKPFSYSLRHVCSTAVSSVFHIPDITYRAELLALHSSCFLPEHRIKFIVRTQEHKKPLVYPHCPCFHFKYNSGFIQVKGRTSEVHHIALKMLPGSLGYYRELYHQKSLALIYCFHGIFPKYRVHNWLLQIRHTVIRKK